MAKSLIRLILKRGNAKEGKMCRAIKKLCLVSFCLAVLISSTNARALFDKTDLISADNKNYKFTAAADIVDPPIDWPQMIGVHMTEQAEATFSCFGTFGAFVPNINNNFPWPEGWPMSSFVSPAGGASEHLFAGGIWIGGLVGGDTLVSVGYDGWQATYEMWPSGDPVQPAVTKIKGPSDFAMRAQFYDTIVDPTLAYHLGDHTPMNLKIVNRGHVWRTAPYDEIVLYDMVITNIGDEVIEEGYLGLFFDADAMPSYEMMGFEDDLAGSLRNLGAGYVIDNDGLFYDDELGVYNFIHPKCFAVKFVSTSFPAADTNFNWWVSNLNADYDFGPRLRPTAEDPWRDFGGFLGTPEGDSNKYYMMRHREWDYDQVFIGTIGDNHPLWMPPTTSAAWDFADGFDTRYLMSIGPFEMLPDSSIRILYSTYTADSIHTDSNNFHDNFNFYFPDIFYSKLNFDNLRANTYRADTLARQLLDPLLRVTGLTVTYSDSDSVVIEWDPYVYDEVTGYALYLTETDGFDWPYPGLMPPWFRPESLGVSINVSNRYKYTMGALDPYKAYYINIANRTSDTVGDPGSPLLVRQTVLTAPLVEREFVFGSGGEPAHLEWTEPPNVNVDFYNIYRFANDDSADAKYRAFYDEGYMARYITPRDSFDIDDTRYYYYSMSPYVQLDSGTMEYFDHDAADSMVYVITAVDRLGFETPFSKEITFNVIEERSKDILVIIPKISSAIDFVELATIRDYYDSCLTDYTYDFYIVGDSLKSPNCQQTLKVLCIDWHDFIPYRMIIIDDGLFDHGDMNSYEKIEHGLARYLLAGGTLCYFGAFHNFAGQTMVYYFPAGYYDVDNTILAEYFGIDSVYMINIDHYYNLQSPPFTDSLFGFIQAAGSGDYPDLNYNSAGDNLFTPILGSFWPDNTVPIVSIFKDNAFGEPIYTYQSLYPQSSWHHDSTVGVKVERLGYCTYLFGFHLWYMDTIGGRALIDLIMDNIPTDIVEPERSMLPGRFTLYQNHPNPFNPSTTIELALPEKAHVRLEIFNLLGQKIATLIDEDLSAGTHRVEWNGSDYASGVYLYKLTAGDFVDTKKMLLLK
jgi:hypothetical protein